MWPDRSTIDRATIGFGFWHLLPFPNQRKQRLELAKKGIIAAERSYELNLQRIENVQGLPSDESGTATGTWLFRRFLGLRGSE